MEPHARTIRPNRWILAAVTTLSIVAGSACSTSTGESSNATGTSSPSPSATASASDTGPAADTADETDPDETESTAPEPDAPAADCDWDSPPVAGPVDVPSGQEGELADAVIGAWQLVAIDGEPVEEDIRYVFPSDSEVLYCQDVPGATPQAVNAGEYTLDGDVIVMNGGAATYTALKWGADVMTWNNDRLGNTYLLARR